MGYYTHYRLQADHPEKHAEIWEWAKENAEELTEAVEGLEGDFSEETKWYTSDEDMEKVSSQFPEVLFQLGGEGEERLDTWVQHWKAGQVVYGWNVETNLRRYKELVEACQRLVTGNNPDLTTFRIKTLLDKWGELK